MAPVPLAPITRVAPIPVAPITRVAPAPVRIPQAPIRIAQTPVRIAQPEVQVVQFPSQPLFQQTPFQFAPRFPTPVFQTTPSRLDQFIRDIQFDNSDGK